MTLALGAAGCGDGQRTPAGPAFSLVVSGDTHGWITPCGCAANQSGGLLRRGTYVEELKNRGRVLVADAGGAPAGTSDYERVKFEAILSGETLLGTVAHNLGGREIALGADYLRSVGQRLSVPFVSVNARGADGRSVAPPWRIVGVDGRRVAFAGVVSPQFASNSDCTIEDPRDALLAHLAAHADDYDALVVLAYLPEDELIAFAQQMPEADAVIGGPTGQPVAPRRTGPTLLASATNKGKFLVSLEAAPARDAFEWSAQIVEMHAKLADSPTQRENLQRYRTTLAERDFDATTTGLAPPLSVSTPQTYRLGGTHACRECHAEDCVSWDATTHARSWETLETRGAHVDPYCQQCHTTGYGLPGGFRSVAGTPARTAVGCESCHGPSAPHAKDPNVHTPFAAADQCVRCHDAENSPEFAYETYWPQIEHGKKAVVPKARSRRPQDRSESRP